MRVYYGQVQVAKEGHSNSVKTRMSSHFDRKEEWFDENIFRVHFDLVETNKRGEECGKWKDLRFKGLIDVFMFAEKNCQMSTNSFANNIYLNAYELIDDSIRPRTKMRFMNTLWTNLKGRGKSNNFEDKYIKKVSESKWDKLPKWIQVVFNKYIDNSPLNFSDEPEKLFWFPRNRKSLNRKTQTVEIEKGSRKVIRKGKVEKNEETVFKATENIYEDDNGNLRIYTLQGDMERALYIKPHRKDYMLVDYFDDKKYELNIKRGNKLIVIQNSRSSFIGNCFWIKDWEPGDKVFLRDKESGKISNPSTVRESKTYGDNKGV